MKNPYELAGDILQETSESAAPAPGERGFTSIDLYGASVCKKSGAEGEREGCGTCEGVCSCFHLENESGVGDITWYRVFPGIELVYNDMHWRIAIRSRSRLWA